MMLRGTHWRWPAVKEEEGEEKEMIREKSNMQGQKGQCT